MPSPNPVTFSKAAFTNQQINSKLIYRRPSGLPEQAEDSSSIGYQKENSISCNSDDKKMIDKEIPNNTNSTAQQQQHQSNNNNNNMGSGYSIRSYQQDDGSKSSFRKWVVKKFDEYKPSLVLENKASVARDHLANERTFLAWLRTSLSFVGIGVAVTQLFRLKGESSKGGNIIGIVFIILGIFFLGFGIVRYFHSQYLMTTGHFPASRGSVLVGTILTILSLTACFLVIIIDN